MLRVPGLVHVKGMFLLFFAISCLILKRPILPLFQQPWPPALIFSTVLIEEAPPWLFAPVLKGAQVRNVCKALTLALWCPQAVRNHVNTSITDNSSPARTSCQPLINLDIYILCWSVAPGVTSSWSWRQACFGSQVASYHWDSSWIFQITNK